MSRNESFDIRIKEAIRVHGDDCVGLRIGARAVDIVTRELALPQVTRCLKVRLGTKQCMADAFKVLLHLEDNQLEFADRDDVIHVTYGTHMIELQLTPRKLRDAIDVLKASDAELFPIIKKSST